MSPGVTSAFSGFGSLTNFAIGSMFIGFRAAGPRFDNERVGDKRHLHNYGHGAGGRS
jgi:hypothetical protein